jgi:hypothetical protein
VPTDDRNAQWTAAMSAAALLCMGVGMPAAAFGADGAFPDYKHMGVASCSSSVCHGKISAQQNRHVALNEYTVWVQDDRHSQGYNRLKSPAAVQIAAKLGLPNAIGAKICLDCHTDNVARAQQGPKYKITDGIGCETCHGGSEKWIESHAQQSATHKANVARGMYPSDQPLARATLCLSCHLGTKDKFATHVIMGAGHPRLSFELDAYTLNQPAHYIVDADYIERKGKIEDMNFWVTGQIESAERFLLLLQTAVFTPGGLVPELSFYECFSCHHPIDNMRWSRNRAGSGINPGTLRLQKANLVTLQALTEVLNPGAAPDLAASAQALVKAGQTDVASARAAAQKLLDRLRAIEPWARRAYSPAEITAVRKTLVRYAAEDRASDFITAEQIVLGVESLSYAVNDHDRRKSALDALFDKVKSGVNFNAGQFADAARRIQPQF